MAIDSWGHLIETLDDEPAMRVVEERIVTRREDGTIEERVIAPQERHQMFALQRHIIDVARPPIPAGSVIVPRDELWELIEEYGNRAAEVAYIQEIDGTPPPTAVYLRDHTKGRIRAMLGLPPLP